MTESPLVNRLIRHGIFAKIDKISNVNAAKLISKHRRKRVSHANGKIDTWMQLLGYRECFRHVDDSERKVGRGASTSRKWWIKE